MYGSVCSVKHNACVDSAIQKTGGLKRIMFIPLSVSYAVPILCHLACCSKVPATTCTRLQDSARHEVGTTSVTNQATKNAARNAYRLIKMSGVAWKIPLSVYKHIRDDGSILEIHPKDLVTYLLENHPIALFGTNDKTKNIIS